MPTVYVRADPKYRTRFHRDPSCRQLTKRLREGHQYHDLVAVDLDDVGVRPCLTCYPDAPRMKIIKRYCPLCDTTWACKHNGGVEVFCKWNPTHKRRRRLWLWPDNNHLRMYRKQA